MKKIYLSTIILFLFSFSIDAQNTCELFFEGDEYEVGKSLQQTADGGFIITGLIEPFGVGLSDGYLLKLDSDCNMMWQSSFGDQSRDDANQIIETIGGGYMIAGRSVQGDNSRYLRKVSENGDLEWERGYPEDGTIYGIQQLPDETYVFVGNIYTDMNRLNIVKVTSTGEIIWEKSFGGPTGGTGQAIAIAADGGYVATGESKSSAGPPQIYLVKVDEAGELVWEKFIGEQTWTEGRDIKATPDGGFIIAGRKDNPNPALLNDCHMVKIDSEGEVVWANSYGEVGFHEAEGVTVTSDGGYGLVGKSLGGASNGISTGIYFVKTAANGDIEFERTYDGGNFASGYDILELEEGGYAMVGTTIGTPVLTFDLYFIKTDENGEVMSTSILELNSNQIDVDVFPNPTNDNISFTIDSAVKLPIRLKLTTTSGSIILDQQVSDHTVVINSDQFGKGMLLYSFYNNEGFIKTGKIISN